jgi:hypothetical protein
MKRWQRWVVLGFVPWALASWASGCNRRGDTQTNWLKTCDTNEDCGDLVCVCGVCTLECSEAADCAGTPAGVTCMPRSSPAVQALCGSNASASLCLYECSRDADCAQGQRCEGHACVGGGGGPGQAGSGNTAAETGGAGDEDAGSTAGGDATGSGNTAGIADSGTTANSEAGTPSSGGTRADAGATSNPLGGAGGTSSVEPVPAGAGGTPSGGTAGGAPDTGGAGAGQTSLALVDRGGKSTALRSDGVAVADSEACPGEVEGEWVSMTETGAPAPSGGPDLYWDGRELLVFNYSALYGLYDPCEDGWRAVSASTTSLSPNAGIEVDARLWFFTATVTVGTVPTMQLSGLDPVSGAIEVRSVVGSLAATNTANVSTGTELIVWGGEVGLDSPQGWRAGTNAGAIYTPADDQWRSMSQAGAPAPRVAPAAWTGTEFAVWGGISADTVPTDGGRTDCGSSYDSQCVEYNDGALYDPTLDRWRPMTKTGAPRSRRDHIVAWTGSRILVWGGRSIDTSDGPPYPITYLGEAALYDPGEDQWTAMPKLDMTSDELYTAVSVWTGERIVLFGPGGSEPRWVYEPSTNSLVALGLPDGTTDCSTPQTQAGAIVTQCRATESSVIAILPPGSMTWQTYAMPAEAPSNPSLLWTGRRLFVWGGMVQDSYGCETPPPPPITGCDPAPPVYGNAGWFMVL